MTSAFSRPQLVPDDGYVPVREAEQLLSLSRNSVLRRVKLGMLKGYPDPDNGYFKVSRASIEEALRRRREAQELAETALPGSVPLETR